MKLQTRQVDFEELASWLDRWQGVEGAWLYHRPAWLAAVAEGLDYRIYGLLTEAGDHGVVAVTPVMETRKGPLTLCGSPLGGSYTEFLGPLLAAGVDDGLRRRVLASQIGRLRHAASYIEWRLHGGQRRSDWDALARFGFEYSPQGTMVLRLGGDAQRAWKGFQSRARNMVRKAEKLSVSVRKTAPGEAQIEHYYALLEETFARRNRRPPHPLRLYQAMARWLAPHDWLWLLVAMHEGRWVAGAMFLVLDRRMIYLSGAASEVGLRLQASSLLQWEAIRLACRHGIEEYDLGGTGNKAIDRFKASFGGRPYSHHRWRYRSPWVSLAERIYTTILRRG